MRVLGIDIGSSSVKCAVVEHRQIVGKIARVEFQTNYTHDRAEVEISRIESAISRAVHSIKPNAGKLDAVAIASMGPSWVGMDSHGKAVTNVITHQDRRSIEQARQIERRIGKSHHLKITGVRPVPGAISSTSWLWLKKNHPEVAKKIDLAGHLPTYFLRKWTGERKIDPGHASFMGVFRLMARCGQANVWSDEITSAIELPQRILPQVQWAGDIGGALSVSAANELGLLRGTPMLVGCIDTTAAMCLAGSKVGQVLNVRGSTDVLAVCTDKPKVHEKLITRAMGTRNRWLSVSTIAAGGSVLSWIHRELYRELSAGRFHQLVGKLMKTTLNSDLSFVPALAGDRMSVEQTFGKIDNIKLSTTREEILTVALASLTTARAERFNLLAWANESLLKKVVVTGGLAGSQENVPSITARKRFFYAFEPHATLRGLSVL